MRRGTFLRLQRATTPTLSVDWGLRRLHLSLRQYRLRWVARQLGHGSFNVLGYLAVGLPLMA